MVTKLDKTAQNVVQLLKERHFTLAAAESCTGGEIAKRFTVPEITVIDAITNNYSYNRGL